MYFSSFRTADRKNKPYTDSGLLLYQNDNAIFSNKITNKI